MRRNVMNGHSSGSSGWVRGGARNTKSMQLASAAIFFMTYFYRAGGPWAPPPSATGATGVVSHQKAKSEILRQFTNPITQVGNVLSESEQQTQVMSELIWKQTREAKSAPPRCAFNLSLITPLTSLYYPIKPLLPNRIG